MVIVPPVLLAEVSSLSLWFFCAAVCLSGAQQEGAEWKERGNGKACKL